jgi:chromosome segregation ATPase
MGRKPVIPESKKAEIVQRLAEGESARSLEKEYHIAHATFRDNFATLVGKVEEAANAIRYSEKLVEQLPESVQKVSQIIAARLRSIELHYANAAESGARSADRLSALAEKQVMRLKDKDPDPEKIKVAHSLHSAAITALTPATAIMQANKAKMEESEKDDILPERVKLILVPPKLQTIDAKDPKKSSK